jgi:predicted nuclease of restriction endonuclease-like (RecB) superfamily
VTGVGLGALAQARPPRGGVQVASGQFDPGSPVGQEHRAAGTSGHDEPAADYRQLLADVLAEVRAARIRAGLAINAERTMLYWRIGHLILARQEQEGWGAAIIDRLAADLAAQFPGMRGWSPRNLRSMRYLAQQYPTQELAAAVARLPWGHLTVLMGQVSAPDASAWYVEQAARYGWSRAVLTHHISAAGRFERVGVDAARTVDAVRGGVDLTDLIGQDHVPDRAGRWWAGPPGVAPRLRGVQDPGGDLDGVSFFGHHRDGLEPPFGGTTLPSSSLARRWIASSASSSAIRLRAAVSSAFSTLVSPGTSPRSIRSWRRQV